MTRCRPRLPVLCALFAGAAAAPSAARADDPARLTGEPAVVHYPDTATGYARFRWFGEVSQYSIKILGTEAVRAGIQVGYVSHDAEYGPVVPVHIVGTTVGFFDTVYPIDNESLSLLGVHDGLRAVFTDSDFNERDYVTRFVMTYDRADYGLNLLRIQPDEADELSRVAIPRELYDDLSMVYDLRGRELQVGHTYVYYNHDGEEFDRFGVVVEGIERVYAPLGEFDCYVLSWIGQPLESHPALPFGDVTLPPTFRATAEPDEIARSYISNDAQRLLIGADIPTDIGMLTIRIAEYSAPSSTYERPPLEDLR